MMFKNNNSKKIFQILSPLFILPIFQGCSTAHHNVLPPMERQHFGYTASQESALAAAYRFIRNVHMAELALLKLKNANQHRATLTGHNSKNTSEDITLKKIETLMASTLTRYLSPHALNKIAQLSATPGIGKAAQLNLHALKQGQQAQARDIMAELTFAEMTDIFLYSSDPSVRQLQAALPRIKKDLARAYPYIAP